MSASNKRPRRGRQKLLPFPIERRGRPKDKNSGVSHRTRVKLKAQYPVHATVRLIRGLPSLRDWGLYRELRGVFVAIREREGFRVVHYSVQGNHIHLIVEAKGREALSRGMQALLIRIAKCVNRYWGRRGTVFADRYHDHVLKSPREVRHALAYVLNNAWRHAKRVLGTADRFASGMWFDGWVQKLTVRGLEGVVKPVSEAHTWLLQKGWRRYGRIGLAEVPGG